MAIIVTMIEIDRLSARNNQLVSNLSCVKLNFKNLETNKNDLERLIKGLKYQVLELTALNQQQASKNGNGIISDLQSNLEKELSELKDRLYDADNKNKTLQENL